MSARKVEVEVGLKEVGCPYPAEDPRAIVWLDGYGKGQADGIERGAKAVGEVYDRHLARIVQ